MLRKSFPSSRLHLPLPPALPPPPAPFPCQPQHRQEERRRGESYRSELSRPIPLPSISLLSVTPPLDSQKFKYSMLKQEQSTMATAPTRNWLSFLWGFLLSNEHPAPTMAPLQASEPPSGHCLCPGDLDFLAASKEQRNLALLPAGSLHHALSSERFWGNPACVCVFSHDTICE